MELESAKRENIWFGVNLAVSLAILFVIVKFLTGFGMVNTQVLILVGTILAYAAVLVLYVQLAKGLLIGYLRGNAVRISDRQLPEIYKVFRDSAAKLGLKREPAFFLVQSGGVLNAFATRMMFRDYVVMYSELLEAAYEEGEKAVSFVIAHELGHVKRNHLVKNALIVLSALIFPLHLAWLRSCEYTCDEIGKKLTGEGSEEGLAVLAAGRKLYRRIDLGEYIESAGRENGFWVWLAEFTSTHPNIPKRIKALRQRS